MESILNGYNGHFKYVELADENHISVNFREQNGFLINAPPRKDSPVL